MIILSGGPNNDSKLSLPISSVAPSSDTYEEGSTSALTTASTRKLPPPRYIEKHPKTQITYEFVPQTIPANSMIMCPPPYLREDYPSYYISVNMNVFTPSSYITTVRRGSWDSSDIVGEFEMGMTARKPSTVCIREHECRMDDVLECHTKMFRGGTTYFWKSKRSDFDVVDLCWEESSFSTSSTLSCFLGKDKATVSLLAKFMPNTLLRRPGKPLDRTRIDITHKGHDYLDDIVISALIVERMRTSPSILKDLPASMMHNLF